MFRKTFDMIVQKQDLMISYIPISYVHIDRFLIMRLKDFRIMSNLRLLHRQALAQRDGSLV